MRIIKLFGVIYLGFGVCIGISNLLSPDFDGNYLQAFIITIFFGLCVVSLIKNLRDTTPDNTGGTHKPDIETTEHPIQNKEDMLQLRIDEVAGIKELPIVHNPTAVILKPQEVCYYQAPASILIIKNQVIGRSGGHGGVSVRVAKGITLHTGKSQGQSIRGDVAYTYPGLFSMTNQRIIMIGEKGFDYPTEKLTAMIPYNGFEGITLQFGKSTHTILMDEPFWIPKIIELQSQIIGSEI